MSKCGYPPTAPAYTLLPITTRCKVSCSSQVLSFFFLLFFTSAATFAQTAEEPWNRLYATNFSSEDVHVIDLNRDQTIAKIKVGSGPSAMALTPNLDKIYVANLWSGTVSIISTALNEVIGEIAIPCDCPKSGPFGLALTPDGAKLYVNNLNDGSVRIVDTATNKVVGKVTGVYDWALRYIAVSPDGEYVWAVGTGEGTLFVIRTIDDQLVARVTGLPSARHLSFTPDGARVYVTGEKFNRLYAVDAKKFALLKVIHFPKGAGTVTVDVDKTGKFALVSNFQGKPSIVCTDPASPKYHTVLAEIAPNSGYLYCIAVAPDGRFAYLTNQSDRGKSPNSVNIIDLREGSPTQNTIIKSLPLGKEPWGVMPVRQLPAVMQAQTETADEKPPQS
jgi:YVTN family beta-propeller protein